MINNLVIAGNLTKDPEVRGQNGNILAFSIACNERYRDNNGEYKDSTSFFNVIKFGTPKQIEYFAGALRKGAKVTIQGKLNQNVWQGNDGRKNYDVQIIAGLIDFFHPQNNRSVNNSNSNGGSNSPGDYYSNQEPPNILDYEYNPDSFYKDSSEDFAEKHARNNPIDLEDPY